MKILTSDTSENKFPESTSNKELADIFVNFFVDKVTKIKSEFQYNKNYNIPTRICTSLSKFQTITQEELIKTIKIMKSTTSLNDPCNTSFILNFSEILVPVWTNIINKPIEEGKVLECWKEAIVHPGQKNNNLGTNLTNYRPIGNLTFFSKLIEKIILNQLINHFRTNNLLPNYQSAYRANHSTETVIFFPNRDVIYNSFGIDSIHIKEVYKALKP